MGRTDRGLIAVIDVGKTHAKLTLTEPESGAIIWASERATTPVQRGPVRDLGAAAVWDWLRASLAAAPQRHQVTAIVPVAHGAAVALLDARGELICAPDYEDPVFDEVADSYAPLRDDFATTFSPTAPRGLNVGRQLHFLQARAPDLFARVRRIVTYPQYWAACLCGEVASEVTSLGAHTDLWRPRDGGFSPMAEREGWAALFAAPRPAGEVLGTLRPPLAGELGLDPACEVLCGIHDSNASYLCHRAVRGTAPFAVVSSGTWTIVMAHGTALSRLREARDMLANVDAFGAPVGTARFMGGREYASVVGAASTGPDPACVPDLLRRGVMALPTFALAGPFQGRPGRLIGAADLDPVGLATLASLYVALVTDVMLDLLCVGGEVIVDGPLAQNEVFAAALAGLRPEPVRVSTARAGTLAGARRLVLGESEKPPSLRTLSATNRSDVSAYREAWRARLDDQGL